MKTKAQELNRPERIRSARFWRWIASGLYLLTMVWLLLSPTVGYGAPEAEPGLVPVVIVATFSYGMLMLWLWPPEKASRGRPERLVQ
jgi:hypothetical protein